MAEALFAVLVLGLLAAVAIPPMVYPGDTRAAECKANVALLNEKVERYAAGHDGWPPADQSFFLRMLAQSKDMPAGGMPKCPYGRPYDYDAAAGRVVPHKH